MNLIDPAATTFFAALSPRDLAALAVAARTVSHRRGAPLFRAGDPCETLAVVLEGFVRLSRAGPDGAAITTRIVGPGGLLGVAALRGAAAQDSHAEALCRVRTLELPVATLLAVGRRCPQVLEHLVGRLLARVGDAYADMALGAQAEVGPRLLHVLRGLAQPPRPGQPAETEGLRRLVVRLSHAELGRLVGAERATVSRALKRLAAQGLVRLERGHVVGVAATGTARPAPRTPGEPAGSP